MGFFLTSDLRSGDFLRESSSEMLSSSGIILAILSASLYSTSLTLARSRTTIFAPKVPKVIIFATRSLPYFSRTYSTTWSRRRMQKSISKSGGETRSRLSIRSKSKPKLRGSISVILSTYATIQPAPEPRPGPTGIPCERAQSMRSQTIKK